MTYQSCNKCGFGYHTSSAESFFYNNIDLKTYCKDCKEFRIKSAWNDNLEIEKLKKDFQIERESFEEALNNAEKWHKEKLVEQLSIKDKRINELEKMIDEFKLNHKIIELEQKFNQLETKYSELIIKEI